MLLRTTSTRSGGSLRHQFTGRPWYVWLGPWSVLTLTPLVCFAVFFLLLLLSFAVQYSVHHGSWGGAPMQPSVLIDGHRVMSWNAYVLLRRCSGRSDGGGEGGGGGGSEGGRGGGGSKGAGSSGKGELHVRWMCVEVVAGAVVAVVAVVVSWNADFCPVVTCHFLVVYVVSCCL